MPHLRPMKSAVGAPRSAPVNVPADKIDTTSDCSLVVIANPVGAVESGCPNVRSQSFMAWMPLMIPVSYLYEYW